MKLTEQLAAAAKETDQAQAATKQAAVLLQSVTKERNSLAAQVSVCSGVTHPCATEVVIRQQQLTLQPRTVLITRLFSTDHLMHNFVFGVNKLDHLLSSALVHIFILCQQHCTSSRAVQIDW